MFKAEPEEESEVNPGKCGKQLAHWILERLKQRGLNADNIYPEDWGYEISLSANKHDKYIGCQNDGDSTAQWACSIEVKQGLISRLTSKIDIEGECRQLQAVVDEILKAEPQISDIRWDEN